MPVPLLEMMVARSANWAGLVGSSRPELREPSADDLMVTVGVGFPPEKTMSGAEV